MGERNQRTKVRVGPKLVFMFRDPDGFGAAIYNAIHANPDSPLRRSEESFELSLEEGYGIRGHKACGEIAHFIDHHDHILVSVLLMQYYEPPVLACAVNEVLQSIVRENGSMRLTLILPFVLPASKLKIEERNASVHHKIPICGVVLGPETDFTQDIVRKIQELPSSTQIHYEPLACLLQFVHVLKVPSIILIGQIGQQLANKDLGEELELILNQVLRELGEVLVSPFSSLSFMMEDKIELNLGKTRKCQCQCFALRTPLPALNRNIIHEIIFSSKQDEPSMKQSIVIKVPLYEEYSNGNMIKWRLRNGKGKDSRSKALQVATSFPGIESIAWKGKDKDQIEIVGDGVDAVEITEALKSKMGHAELVSVTTVVEENKGSGTGSSKVKVPENKDHEISTRNQIIIPYPPFGFPVPETNYYDPAYNCYIM
ncbi:hypothetical protein Dimus_009789 [Dionaea muscipula]